MPEEGLEEGFEVPRDAGLQYKQPAGGGGSSYDTHLERTALVWWADTAFLFVCSRMYLLRGRLQITPPPLIMQCALEHIGIEQKIQPIGNEKGMGPDTCQHPVASCNPDRFVFTLRCPRPTTPQAGCGVRARARDLPPAQSADGVRRVRCMRLGRERAGESRGCGRAAARSQVRGGAGQRAPAAGTCVTPGID